VEFSPVRRIFGRCVLDVWWDFMDGNGVVCYMWSKIVRRLKARRLFVRAGWVGGV